MHNLAFADRRPRFSASTALIVWGALACTACQDASDSEPAADTTAAPANGSSGEGSEGADGADAETGDEDPFAALDACDESDFAALPWSGPAFDPESGELIAPLEPPFVVSSTVGWAKTDDASIEQLGGLTQSIIEDIFTHEGLLGGTFGSSEACGAARTLTLWRDEASMLEFAFSGPHLEAIPLAATTMQSFATTHWTETESTEPPTWQDANARIAAAYGP